MRAPFLQNLKCEVRGYDFFYAPLSVLPCTLRTHATDLQRMISMSQAFTSPKTFLTKSKARDIPVFLIPEDSFESWLKKQNKELLAQATEEGFTGEPSSIFLERDVKGCVATIHAVVKKEITGYGFAKIADSIRSILSKDLLETCSFTLKAEGFNKEDITQAHIAWALSNYAFDPYKKNDKALLKLVWHKDADRKRVNAYLDAVFLLRHLINTPANDLGPDEMEATVRTMSKTHGAKVKVIKGAALEKDFPLIHTVGKGSPRAPRLIDLSYGKAKDPKVTIVGKGVVFDTGGLDIKPSQYMRLMKKDMGGAAHALALAQMIIALKVPVNLRLLIPCVENAVGGASFRPGDVIKSRKGLTVENTNTDAEGRLILADALALASEDKPDFIVDFATLTGSARAALGPDVPAMFSNNETLANSLQKLSIDVDDPLWAMPLWDAYDSKIESDIADLVNSADQPGDLIYSALFLQKFLNGTPDWVHLDVFAWENNGRPGRSKGGTEMGLRAVLALIEERYG